MKNKSKSFWLAMLATVSMVALFGCGDDDSQPGNQLTLDGETIKFTQAYLESELDQEDESGAFSYHTFLLTGGGLTINETGDLSGSGDLVVFGLISESPAELKEGTYKLGLNTEIGQAEYFEILYGLSESGLDTYYAAYRGTIKVSKSGEDRYTLSFDFDVFTAETETQDEEFVSGKIKGNYKGTVEIITGTGQAKLPSGKSKKGSKSFTWQ